MARGRTNKSAPIGELFEAGVLGIVTAHLERVTDNTSYRKLKQEFSKPVGGDMVVKNANFSHQQAYKNAEYAFKLVYPQTDPQNVELFNTILKSSASAAASILSDLIAKFPPAPQDVNITVDAVGGWAAYGDAHLALFDGTGSFVVNHILEMKMYQDFKKDVTYYNGRDTRLFGEDGTFWRFIAASDKGGKTPNPPSKYVSTQDFWMMRRGGPGVKPGEAWRNYLMINAIPKYFEAIKNTTFGGSVYQFYSHLKNKAGRSPGPKIMVRGMKETKGKTSLVFSMEAMIEAMKDRNKMEMNTRRGSESIYFEAAMKHHDEKLTMFKVSVDSASKKFFETAKKDGYTKQGYPGAHKYGGSGKSPWIGINLTIPNAYFNYAMQKLNSAMF